MSKDLFNNLLIGVLSSAFVTTIVLDSSHGPLKNLLYVVIVICFGILLFNFYSQKLWYLLKGKLTIEELEEIISKFVTEDGTPFFKLYEKNKVINFLNLSSRRNKPIVFFQLRLKHWLNWIDGVYLSLLRELAKNGFKVIILIHDFPYELDHNGLVKVPKEDKAFNLDVHEMIQNIDSFTLGLCRVERASDFFSNEQNAKTFVHVIYKNFLPSIVNINLFNLKEPAMIESSIERTHNLRYLIGMLRLLFEKEKSLKFVLIWEGRGDWWSLKSNIIGDKSDKVFRIEGTTIKSGTGIQLSTREPNKSIDLNDKKFNLESVITHVDQYTLANICKLLLFSDEKIKWSSKSKEYLEHRVVVGILDIQKEYKLKIR